MRTRMHTSCGLLFVEYEKGAKCGSGACATTRVGRAVCISVECTERPAERSAERSSESVG
eukprot:364631-Chlamydomonas_euryale.AAC.17